MLGVFDSGSGGLTVAQTLSKAFPHVSMMYLGDHARSPYGDRPVNEIEQYTKECVDWLFAQGCDQVLLACNTASAVALDYLDDDRVIGIIEPTRDWLSTRDKEDIGLLATTATVTSGVYSDVVAYQHSCPAWTLFIEKGNPKSEGAKEVVTRDVNTLIEGRELNTVVLACTHYPYFHDLLAEILPSDVTVVDQGDMVANWLKDHNRPAQTDGDSALQFFTTDDPIEVSRRAADFFGSPVTFQKATI
ncbi:glutamate racemase [Candidatus Uhrbacteria bacterium]|jgi:glutamate racemase|nr:glutamate racemase [Candidatus Uhrbacteria bacterium]